MAIITFKRVSKVAWVMHICIVSPKKFKGGLLLLLHNVMKMIVVKDSIFATKMYVRKVTCYTMLMVAFLVKLGLISP